MLKLSIWTLADWERRAASAPLAARPNASARCLLPAILLERWLQVCRINMTFITANPTWKVTFSNVLSKLKTQSSNVSFHWNVAKEAFELWAWALKQLSKMSPQVGSAVLLCLIDPRVRKIRNEASSCPGIFSRTLRFYYVASSPSFVLRTIST